MKRFWTTTVVIGLLAAPAGAFAQSGAPSGRLWLVASKSVRSGIRTETPEPITVKPGDTLNAISRKTGISVSDLAKVNKLKPPYNIRIGSKIELPGKSYYVVQSGDTLYSLARRFGASASDLAAFNSAQVNDTLRVNQRLYLPDDTADAQTTRPEPEPKPAPPVERYVPPPQPVYARPPQPTPAPVQSAPVAAEPITTAPVEVGAAPRAAAAPIPAPEEAAPKAAPPPPPISETQPLAELRPPRHGGLFGLFGRKRDRDKEDQEAVVPPPAPTPKPASAPARQSSFETVPERASTPAPKPPPPAVRPAAPGPGQIIPTSPPPTQSDVVTAGRGKFLWPATGQVISGFGPKSDGQRNDGVNIAAASGDSVRSAASGEVVYAGNQVPSFGNLVLIKHPGGWVTAYAHLAGIDVKNRDQVSQGQRIGDVGQTGAVDRPQLHFEIRYAPTPRDKATPVDPMTLLPAR
jgi:murein DD-endopeptidase MepM/ murein hydrolase activator NlpD